MSVFAWVRCQQQPTSTPPWFPKGAWCWLSISALVCTSLHRLISPLAEEVCERANGPDSEANADTDKPIHGYLLCPMTCRMGTVLATANIPVLSLHESTEGCLSDHHQNDDELRNPYRNSGPRIAHDLTNLLLHEKFS